MILYILKNFKTLWNCFYIWTWNHGLSKFFENTLSFVPFNGKAGFCISWPSLKALSVQTLLLRLCILVMIHMLDTLDTSLGLRARFMVGHVLSLDLTQHSNHNSNNNNTNDNDSNKNNDNNYRIKRRSERLFDFNSILLWAHLFYNMFTALTKLYFHLIVGFPTGWLVFHENNLNCSLTQETVINHTLGKCGWLKTRRGTEDTLSSLIASRVGQSRPPDSLFHY